MKLLTLVLGLILAIFFLADGCINSPAFKKAVAYSKELVFTKSPADSPVVGSGQAGQPIFPADPCVIKDEEGYHLFVTTIFCKKGGEYYYSWDAGDPLGCDLSHIIGTTAYAFSADQGLSWEFRENPVILPGPEDWQSDDLETPFAARLGDTLYLFYSALGIKDGQAFENRYQIGGAILSLNGRTIRQRLMEDRAIFEKLSQPLLPHNLTNTAFDNNTQEPSVVVKDGKLEMFYIGIGLTKPGLPMGAKGQDIKSLGLACAVFNRNLVLESKSDGYLINWVNIPEVKYINGRYHAFATSLKDGFFHEGEQIHYYTSADGLTWQGPELLLEKGASGAFDDWGIMAPTVVIESEQLMLFYSGWGVENHPCFPEPFTPDIRFGQPTPDNQKCIFGSVGRASAPLPDGF